MQLIPSMIMLYFNFQNGRISKRFSFIYSGSEKEGMVHIKPCSVSAIYIIGNWEGFGEGTFTNWRSKLICQREN